MIRRRPIAPGRDVNHDCVLVETPIALSLAFFRGVVVTSNTAVMSENLADDGGHLLLRVTPPGGSN